MERVRCGMIFVLTGNGKGKTTSAIGMGIRAVGAGKRVLMVQFLKIPTSETNALKEVCNFTIKSFGEKGFPAPKEVLERTPQIRKEGVREISEKDRELAREGWAYVKQSLEEKLYDFLILDELTHAINLGLLEKEEVLSFLKRFKEGVDIVITGRNCPEEILDIADLVTDMHNIKHPFEKGTKPRKGIEY